MIARSKIFGHEITFDNEWQQPKQMICPICKQPPTKEGHDPCLGTLPGVKAACCGHGNEGYVLFENGVMVRGRFRVLRQTEVKNEKTR